MKLSNKTIFFFSTNGGQDKCASHEVNEVNCLKEVQYVQECHKVQCHCAPLQSTVTAKFGHIQIASHLLLYGTRPQVRDCHGATATQ